MGAVWPPFRGHRRRRTARRPRACGADGLSAGNIVALNRRHLRRRRAGFSRPVHLDAPRRAFARRSHQDRDGARARRHRHDRHSHDHDHSAGGAGARRRQGARGQSLGRVHRFRDAADRRLHGRLWPLSAARAHRRNVGDRLRSAALEHRLRPHRVGERAACAALFLQGRDPRLHADRLWLRRLGLAGVAVARAARLSVDLPEGRHDHVARDRHFHRLARPPDAGGQPLHRRHGPGLRRQRLPVPVHHHRLRRGVGLSCARVVRHDAEDDRRRDADALHRLWRDADGILRRGHGADRRKRAGARRLFRHEQRRRR